MSMKRDEPNGDQNTTLRMWGTNVVQSNIKKPFIGPHGCETTLASAPCGATLGCPRVCAIVALT